MTTAAREGSQSSRCRRPPSACGNGACPGLSDASPRGQRPALSAGRHACVGAGPAVLSDGWLLSTAPWAVGVDAGLGAILLGAVACMCA
jgi:hypothetical protein